MQALGLIETRGLLPAIESADVMLKTAQVELVGRTFVGGGLVTIIVTGDVGAVKAAVEAGAAAVEKIAHLSLVSQHVIARPHYDIESMVVVSTIDPLQKQDIVTKLTDPDVDTKESSDSGQIMLNNPHKEGVDAFVKEFGLEKSVEGLKSLSVVNLRNLAREYKELDIAGRAISRANKDLLILKIKEYYESGSSS